MNYPKVILKSGKDQSLRRYHPWIFSGAIKKIIGHVNEGDLVYVTDNKDEFLAIGHYQIGSIAVRIIHCLYVIYICLIFCKSGDKPKHLLQHIFAVLPRVLLFPNW